MQALVTREADGAQAVLRSGDLPGVVLTALGARDRRGRPSVAEVRVRHVDGIYTYREHREED